MCSWLLISARICHRQFTLGRWRQGKIGSSSVVPHFPACWARSAKPCWANPLPAGFPPKAGIRIALSAPLPGNDQYGVWRRWGQPIAADATSRAEVNRSAPSRASPRWAGGPARSKRHPILRAAQRATGDRNPARASVDRPPDSGISQPASVGPTQGTTCWQRRRFAVFDALWHPLGRKHPGFPARVGHNLHILPKIGIAG